MSIPPRHPVPEATWVVRESDVGMARRRVKAFARTCGAVDPEAVALAVTELATNLVEHAGGGFVAALRDGESLEVVTVDQGDWDNGGIPGLGGGLAGVRRVSDRVDIDRSPGGAIVRARFGPATDSPLAAFVVPLQGEEVAGDGVWFEATDDGWTVVVIDALGHGPAAAAERDQVLAALGTIEVTDPTVVYAALSAALHGKRGAAIRWARAFGDRLETFGVGNVEGSLILPGGVRLFDSQPGIVGRTDSRRGPPVRTYEIGGRGRVVLHTDGLTTASRHAEGSLGAHPVIEAARRLRDFRRVRDDAGVFVLDFG